MKVFLVLLISFAFLACEGPEGPAGPDGVTGAQGPSGPAGPGSRKVYSGVIVYPWQVISVPELDENNMPNVAVYVEAPEVVAKRIGGAKYQPVGWVQLPYSYTDGEDIWFKYVFFGPHEVLIGFCVGLEYRIVVIE